MRLFLSKIAYVGFFRHFLCVFVFVFVSSYYLWIAFIISFQNMYGYRGLWSYDGWTDGHTHSPIPLIDSAHLVVWAEWKGFKIKEGNNHKNPKIFFSNLPICECVNIRCVGGYAFWVWDFLFDKHRFPKNYKSCITHYKLQMPNLAYNQVLQIQADGLASALIWSQI